MFTRHAFLRLKKLLQVALIAAGVFLLVGFATEANAAYLTRVPTTASAPANKATGKSCPKTCASGQACGNICISRRYVCHRPPPPACVAKAAARKTARR